MRYISDTRNRILSWVAVPLAAAMLAIPAFAVGEAGSAQGPELPTARQIAQHQGRVGHPARLPLPTARQVAMHEGRLVKSAPATASSGTPTSGGISETALIALFSGGALLVLAGGGFVVGRHLRTRRSLQPGA